MNPCILVFGMPRSGTTWIGKLFDSHPDTLYRHEPDSMRQLTMPLFPEKKDAPEYRDELVIDRILQIMNKSSAARFYPNDAKAADAPHEVAS